LAEEKGKEKKAQGEGKGRNPAQGGRKAPQKTAPAGPSAAGISLVWVVVVLVLLFIEGIYMTAHSARGLNRLSTQVALLEGRAQQAHRKQVSLAADYIEEAARYAAEENYGLTDRTIANARQMIELATLLGSEIESGGLRTVLRELENLRVARDPELAGRLQEMAERLRGMATARPEALAKGAGAKLPAKALPGGPARGERDRGAGR